MHFPNGVTGFYSSIDNKPNEIDENYFKSICFDLVRRNQGKLLKIDKVNLIKNTVKTYFAWKSKYINFILKNIVLLFTLDDDK